MGSNLNVYLFISNITTSIAIKPKKWKKKVALVSYSFAMANTAFIEMITAAGAAKATM